MTTLPARRAYIPVALDLLRGRARAAHPYPGRRPMRLLLVEDRDDIRYAFAMLLRSQGFEVREAADGREAIDALAGYRPDVVLTDWMMPDVDGIELTRHIRAVPALAAVPVVVMTAAPSPEAEAAARRAGATGFVPKPFDSRSLAALLVGLPRPVPVTPLPVRVHHLG